MMMAMVQATEIMVLLLDGNMNERIEELIKQADYNAPGGQWKEYFAELIVKECMSIVSKSGNSKAEVLNDLEEFIWGKK
jgi:hypothetical protein